MSYLAISTETNMFCEERFLISAASLVSFFSIEKCAFLVGDTVSTEEGIDESASVEWFLWNVDVGDPRAVLLKSVKDLEAPSLYATPGDNERESRDLRCLEDCRSSEGGRCLRLWCGLDNELAVSTAGSCCCGSEFLSATFLRCFLAGQMYSIILCPTFVSSCKHIG